MASTPDVRVRLSAEGQAEVIAALRKVQQEGNAAASKSGTAFKGLNSVLASTKALLASLGLVFTVATLSNLVRTGAAAADEMGKLAQKMGTTTERASALAFQARQDDVEIAALTSTMGRFNKRLDELRAGEPGATDAFRRIGLAAEDFEGKDTAEALELVARRLGEFKDGGTKAAASMDIFGKSGAELLPLLKSLDEQGLQGVTESATEAGAVFTKEMAEASDRLGDALGKLKQQASGVSAQFVTGLAPDVTAALEDVSKALASNATDGENWARQLGRAVGLVISSVQFGVVEIVASLKQLLIINATILRIAGNFRSAGSAIADMVVEFKKAQQASDDFIRTFEARQRQAEGGPPFRPTEPRDGRGEVEVPDRERASGAGEDAAPFPAADEIARRQAELHQAFEERRRTSLALAEEQIAGAHTLLDLEEEMELTEEERNELARIAAGLTEKQVALLSKMQAAMDDFNASLAAAVESGLVDFLTEADFSAQNLLRTIRRIVAQLAVRSTLAQLGSLLGFSGFSIPGFGGAAGGAPQPLAFDFGGGALSKTSPAASPPPPPPFGFSPRKTLGPPPDEARKPFGVPTAPLPVLKQFDPPQVAAYTKKLTEKLSAAPPTAARAAAPQSITGQVGLEVGLAPGLTLDQIDTPRGHGLIVTVISKNPRAVKKALGL